jgi:alkylation response protein AidB-like acyl-CoA dehydrogenase
MTMLKDEVVGPAGAAEDSLIARARAQAPLLEREGAACDRDGAFVAGNYAELKRRRFFSAGVPAELGGGGAAHAEVAEALRLLAHGCPSTALALSMHQHLIATAAWRWRHAGGPDTLLRKVAAGELMLVSTGANDWLESGGTLERIDGGCLFTATKPFASGCPAGDIAITSAPYDDPQRGPLVLHFAVPLRQQGVSLVNDWDTMGMRGTGSDALQFDRVFVPDAAVSLQRPRGAFHPSWTVVLAMAMPLIMSVYLGAAEKAAGLALALAGRGRARARAGGEELLFQLAGEMDNELITCRVMVADMVRLAAAKTFEPAAQAAGQVLSRKTVAARAALAAVEKAMELAGGRGYYRAAGIERLLRDVKGAQFHPLPAAR